MCIYACIIVNCVSMYLHQGEEVRKEDMECVYLCVYSCLSMPLHQGEEPRAQEDSEFQRLEKELSQEEEKENHTQTLLREIADCQRSTVTRKVQNPVHVLGVPCPCPLV